MSEISFSDFGGELHLGDKVQLFNGDSREVLKRLPDNSIDSVCCDPPYALVSIVKRFGGENAAPASDGDVYARASAGFMGKQWDTGETAFAVEFWAEVMRVLKPGGHVIAASGTRTYHRLAVAIEDAGFEIRDMISWLYGAGFPKSHSVERNAVGKICACASPECDVRPMLDANVPATIDVENQCGEVLFAGMPEQGASGTMLRPESTQGGDGVGECVMEGRSNTQADARELSGGALCEGDAAPGAHGAQGWLRDGAPRGDGADDRQDIEAPGSGASPRPQSGEQRAEQSGTVALQSESQTGGAWPTCRGCGLPRITPGLGTALKPACEPWVLARKPLTGTVAGNVLEHGTGALNVDGCRVGTDVVGWGGKAGGTGETVCTPGNKDGDPRPVEGRWPANVIHDGSDEVLDAFPHTKSGSTLTHHVFKESENGSMSGKNYARSPKQDHIGDEGSAARFFYSAKADALDRVGSKHPTVKPVDLMQYLCRLITPPGGIVLDPFAGSGSTGEAAWREGFRCVLIEREADYADDIRERLRLASAGEKTKRRAIAEKKGGADLGGLFCLE